MNHKAGFVNIIGKPNAGKSTLLNLLLKEKLAIVTPKAQTTRQRIMGIINTDEYQIVLSDTPGFVGKEASGLHKRMNTYVKLALEDADVLLYLIDAGNPKTNEDLDHLFKNFKGDKLILLNKIDLFQDQNEIEEKMVSLTKEFGDCGVFPISALHKFNVQEIFKLVVPKLPESEPYFPKDEFTDRSQRFFASEIVREKIMLSYSQEVPYSCAVVIERFKDDPDIIRMEGRVYVERDSQKGILIGKGGEKLKKMSTLARIDLEQFFGKQVFIRLQVKVQPDWRNNEKQLGRFGYHTTE